MSFQKQESFVLKTFFHMANACVRESARTQDMRQGM